MKKLLIGLTLLSSISSFAGVPMPSVGTYHADAVIGHDDSPISAGSCAVEVLSRKYTKEGKLESIDIIYKSSRSKPVEITLDYSRDERELIGVANPNTGVSTDNPEVMMIGSGKDFGLVITTDLTVFASLFGMNGDKQCHNFEPMELEAFENY